jgi:hypothetical protein
MVFDEITPELDRLDNEMPELNKLGAKLLTVVAMVIFPVLFEQIPTDHEKIEDEMLLTAK